MPAAGGRHGGQRGGKVRVLGCPSVVCLHRVKVAARQTAGDIAKHNGYPEGAAVTKPLAELLFVGALLLK